MTHVSDPVLFAVRDGQAVDRRAYAHIDACLSCRRTLLALGATPPAPPIPRRRKTTIAIAGAALVCALSAIAPVRSAAFGFVEIFEPRSIALVPMTPSDIAQLANLPDLTDLGITEQASSSRSYDAVDLRTARALAGYPLRLPTVPGYVTASSSVVMPPMTQFTFSDAKARMSAARRHAAWRPMPAGIDGSMLRVAYRPAVVTALVDTSGGKSVRDAMLFNLPRRRAIAAAPGGRTMRSPSLTGSVFVAQMPVPQVGSTGVSAHTIESYLLSQPGVPPRLAAAFASLRDPTTTLPIPIPIDRAYLQPVTVDGTAGFGLVDETGFGSVVFWQRGGMLYALGGVRPARDILAIANSLR